MAVDISKVINMVLILQLPSDITPKVTACALIKGSATLAKSNDGIWSLGQLTQSATTSPSINQFNQSISQPQSVHQAIKLMGKGHIIIIKPWNTININWYNTNVASQPNYLMTRNTASVFEVNTQWQIGKPQKIRHPKEGRFNSHRADPRFPFSAPYGGPRSPNAFWVQHRMRGNVNVLHWRSTPFLEGTRVETANVGMFHRVEWGSSINRGKMLTRLHGGLQRMMIWKTKASVSYYYEQWGSQ